MTDTKEDNSATEGIPNPKQGRLFAAGGILAALVASSCCVAPLALVTLGVSGAWIGNLTALEPYKPYFLGVTALLLAAGFWHVYIRPKKACEEGSYCARPSSSRITKSVLWIATFLALLSATVNFWAPLFY
jgi:mercuric ion transport protein